MAEMKRLMTAENVDQLNRLQRRILYRSHLLNYILDEEKFASDCTADAKTEDASMGDTFADLLDDISAAARAIATIMETVR